MVEVPLNSIKCGKFCKKQSNCYLTLPESGLLRLDFIYSDGNDDILTLQCKDITAVDLRVEAKFGSIEAMKGTLLVECSVLQTTKTALKPSGDIDSAPPPEISGKLSETLVRATFHVNETGAVRDVIRKLRGQYSRSNSDQGKTQNTPQNYPDIFQEGLPSWVEYVPHYLYSKRTRRGIQLAIYIYLIFSVTWALWQLYRYVDFVRECIRPLIEFLQYQYRILDHLIRFFNTLLEEYTVQWLCFIKPLCTVISAIAAPLLQIFGQLGPIFQVIAQGVAKSCTILWPIFKPVVNVGYQLGYLVVILLRVLKSTLARLWFLFVDNSVATIIVAYFRATKHMLWVLWNSLGQAQLDPLKVQLVIVRTTVIQSGKAVGFGIVRLVRNIYKVIWLRRSARINKEE